MRTEGSNVTNAASTERSQRNDGGRQERASPDAEAVRRFQALLPGAQASDRAARQAGMWPGAGANDRASGHAGVGSGDQSESLWSAGELANLQVRNSAGDPNALASLAAPSAASQAAALVELLERHVRRMLASEKAGSGEPGARVMLHLAGTELAGTDLWLTRGYDGWTLQADTADDYTASLIREFSPALVARFGECELGELEVQVNARD